MSPLLIGLLVVGFALLAWVTQRGQGEANAEYNRRRDEKKADAMIAEVRRELAAKNAAESERAD